MLKNVTSILFIGLLLTGSIGVAAENVPSLDTYSRLKYLRSLIPAKSKLETELDYQQKIESLNLPVPFIELEVSPHQGKYNLDRQQLQILLNTTSRHFGEYSNFPETDKKLAAKKLFDDSDNAILLDYRLDSTTTEKKLLDCPRLYGKDTEYTHRIYERHQYVINTLGENFESIFLNVSPQVAKKYFTQDESRLNERLVIKLVLKPVLPFYSFYTSHSYSDCPDSYEQRWQTYQNGVHESSLNHNHLIHTNVISLELIDRQTGEQIYRASFTER